jgi:hypothetical protein
MDPTNYHNVAIFITSKKLTIWGHNWKMFNGQNVKLMVVHILIYHYVVKSMQIGMMQYSFGVHL